MPALSAQGNCLWRRSFQPCWPRPKIDSLLAQSLLLFFILESQVEGWVRNLVPLPAGTAAQGKTCVRANPALEAVRPSHRTGLRLSRQALLARLARARGGNHQARAPPFPRANPAAAAQQIQALLRVPPVGVESASEQRLPAQPQTRAM